MIEFTVPYKIDLRGDKFVATNLGVTYFEYGGEERVTEIIKGAKEHYGDWLDENEIAHTFDVKVEYEVDHTCTLISVIRFDNEEDAMAFKLVWL